jgi:hypothetical protein
MPSFENTLRRWASVVRGERNSWATTSLFERPSVTHGQRAAATGTNYSKELFEWITEYLTPGHLSVLPG